MTVHRVVPSAFRFPEGSEMWVADDPLDGGSERTAHNGRVERECRDVVFGRSLSSLVPGVHAADGATLGLTLALLTAVATVACWLPARQAARIDPTTALRSD